MSCKIIRFIISLNFTSIYPILKLLNNDNFIKFNDGNKYILTTKGHIATHIRETHCLVFSELIDTNVLQQFDAKELVGILSCFTNITVPEEKRAVLPVSDYTNVKDCITNIYDINL